MAIDEKCNHDIIVDFSKQQKTYECLRCNLVQSYDMGNYRELNKDMYEMKTHSYDRGKDRYISRVVRIFKRK